VCGDFTATHFVIGGMAHTVRTAYKVWSGVAAGLFCLVAITDLSSNHTTTAASAPAVSSTVSPAVTAPSVAAPVAAAPTTTTLETGQPTSGGETVTVDRVIDGDTFVAGGQKVRVLGIDSCESNTYGGRQATDTARTMLEGEQVVLRSEPGVDRDKYGRELRYVDMSVSGSDFGDYMVSYDHTAVYAGKNEASAAYVAKLRADDHNSRTCSAPAERPGSSSTSSDDNGSINWPSPGDQGLPDGALTGGFCARHRWC
jgi:endonuclease YncB( thermonuclease family)